MIWEPRGPDRSGAETWVGVTMGRTLLLRDWSGCVFALSDLQSGEVLGAFTALDEAKAAGERVTG